MSSAECRLRPAIRLIVPFSPASGHKTLKLVGPIQREHATPAQPTLFRGGKIFTIQPFSRKCPIGRALDIPFENWTSSLRIYKLCSFSNPVSFRDLLTCDNASCLTRCHRAFVSNSCHFFQKTAIHPFWRHMQSVRDADNPFGRFRHVTGFPEELTRSRALVGDEDPAAQCVWYHRSWIVSTIYQLPLRYHAVPHRFPSMVVAQTRKYPITCCCSVAVPNDTPGAIAVSCSTDESGRAWARIRFPRPRTRDGRARSAAPRAPARRSRECLTTTGPPWGPASHRSPQCIKTTKAANKS